ncbi:MAG: UDP-N-acetylmuramate--L-alanine ligase, partial [Bacteroidales bacterium]|nr:UDP-N-acetylmuramate--L-alanine ligase [Bacteroidales bacterium]
MKMDQLHSVYFLGAGGIGMSGLARYFHRKGVKVYGYDRTQTSLTLEMQGEGIDLHFSDSPEMIPANIDLVIYTPAVPPDLEEFVFLKKKDIPFRKRSEILGMLTKFLLAIAIAGTHGKTSVSAMSAFLLDFAGKRCNAFLGGISKNFQSNLVLSENPEIMVVEADEFDRSFLKLFPQMAVVTSVEPDHLDIYGDLGSLTEAFQRFVSRVPEGGKVIVNKEFEEYFSSLEKIRLFTYSVESKADFYATNIALTKERLYRFDAVYPGGVIKDITLGVPGFYNIGNAMAAIAVALESGIGEEAVRQALPLFRGINRRFEVLINREDIVFIDDYAHHPTEIEAFTDAVRKIYRGKKVAGIFQPHLYSRTRDLAAGFAESLENLDEIILTDIYPARENPIEGVSSKMIFDLIRSDSKHL